MNVLGVDIGGSGIKGAIVDTVKGELVTERHRIPTPQPATPEAVAEVLKELVQHFDWTGPIGCGFPAAIQHGVVKTAANIDDGWLGCAAADLFSQVTGCPVFVLNDADAAGVAEMAFGVGHAHQDKVVLMITIGTGLGSAFFTQGQLLPNTELGHIILKGHVAEHYTSDAARKRDDLGWGSWGKRFNQYLERMQRLFWPDVIILGGGASKKLEKFQDKIELDIPVLPAEFLNQAGIVGAALFASQKSQ